MRYKTKSKTDEKKQATIILVGMLISVQIFIISLMLLDKAYIELFYTELIFLGIVGLIFLDVYLNKRRRKVNFILRKLKLLPRPTEATLFVMALTSLVLLLTEGDIWSEISALVLKEQVNSGITLGYIVIGICLSIYHGFSKREKKPWEIEIMKWFVTATLAGVAVSSAFFIYSERNFGYIVFTIWNGIQAFVLLFMSGKDYVGEYVKLHTREASYIEVLSGVIVVFLVLYIESLYNTHWSIAFSSVLIIWSIVGSYFKVKKDNFLIKNLQ